MKTTHKTKQKLLTFGELITEAYDTCGKRRAAGMIKFAVNANMVSFRGHRHALIS